MKITALAIAIAAMFANTVGASDVDESGVTTFTTGTPAVALEVNNNFSALVTAINDNATRIAALELTNSSVNSAADLNGALYCIYEFVVDVGASDVENSGEPDYFQGWKTAGVGTTTAGQILFSSDTAGMRTITESDYYQQQHPLSVNPGEENGNESFSFTYSTPLLTLTFTDEDGTESYTGTISADGNILFIAGSDSERADDNSGTFGTGFLLLGIRAASCI
jgi:hypothetical protein